MHGRMDGTKKGLIISSIHPSCPFLPPLLSSIVCVCVQSSVVRGIKKAITEDYQDYPDDFETVLNEFLFPRKSPASIVSWSVDAVDGLACPSPLLPLCPSSALLLSLSHQQKQGNPSPERWRDMVLPDKAEGALAPDSPDSLQV